ncbi:hypothetical protein CDG81_12975 [Actinopolyspora erythraea]|uniref:Phytanoyl-CoA dioxygenase n=1 Tax=Actinopolyspora erythraea TaxID=414996 RepID=A0A223RT88_9ACTN|nr:phytanoyl-CoA dioxygenase family protein [Actinopolyspora erythraea]ASU79047.1 hypothetical protein CDG81_12975 [Actinopolyspora erythraea]
MTAVHVCRGTLDDEERGDLVFAGDLVIFPGVTGLDAFRDRVDELVRTELGSTDPETAQFGLAPTEYLDAVREVQQRVRNDTAAHRLLLAALENTGIAASDTYWDWVHLRVLPHGKEHAGAGTSWHRDTWASNLYAQTNWWTPIYPITAGRTITFSPAQWSEAVANTSSDWVPRAYRGSGAENAGGAVTPELVHPQPTLPELQVVINPGDLLCFSGAHLHGTVPNESGRARFSVEVRTLCRTDVEQGRGASNVDGHASRSRHQWFHHVVDGTSPRSP